MEGPQDNRPLKKFKHLTIRARNCHGVSKDEQLRRLQLFLEVELAKKKLQIEADLAANIPYVRPAPIRIPTLREYEESLAVEVPDDQVYKVVRFHGTFSRLKVLRNPVAPPSPPKSPPPQSPPPIPMPEEQMMQVDPPQVEQPQLEPQEQQQVEPKQEPAQVEEPKQDEPKQEEAQGGSQQVVPSQGESSQGGAPKVVPPQGEQQPINEEDKPPIMKVLMVRLVDCRKMLPSSTVMAQHDYARPSTSRSGQMAKEELEDIHANFHYEGRNWRNQATYKVTDIRKRKRLEMERKAAEEAAEAALPQYRIVPTLNLRPVITRRARETVVTEAVSSSSDTSKQSRKTCNGGCADCANATMHCCEYCCYGKHPGTFIEESVIIP